MCCGTESSRDWIQSQILIPNSCCKNYDANMKTHTTCVEGYHESGCLEKLKNKIQDQSTIIIGVGIGIAFIQVRVLLIVSNV